MSRQPTFSRRFTATLAIICFLPPLLLFIAYSGVGIRYGAMSQDDKVQVLMENFPRWMQNYTALIMVSTILCVVAIVLAARSYKKRLLSVRVLMLMVVLISIFLLLFNISQLL